jgi:hypothetical protein
MPEIAGFPVIASYAESPLDAEKQDAKFEKKYKPIDPTWQTAHVVTSQYGTQYRKCGNRRCCKAFRCKALARILPQRFLPYPRVIVNTPRLWLLDHTERIPKEAHFATPAKISSVGPEVAHLPCVSKCGMHFPSKEAMIRHRVWLHKCTRERLVEQGAFETNVVQIIGMRRGEYLFCCDDGNVEWIEFPHNHVLVAKFEEERKNRRVKTPIIRNVSKWARRDVVKA